jgi:hypothetical protein
VNRTLTLLAAGLLLTASTAFGQSTIKAGTLELALYGGGTFDLPGAAGEAGLFDSQSAANDSLQYKPGRKINPLAGGSLAVSLAKILWVYGDYFYVFPDRTSASVSLFDSTGLTTTSRHYWNGDGGIELMFPTVQRVVPYLDGGVGILHQDYDTTSAYTNVDQGNGQSGNTYRALAVVNNIFTPHIGGGVRIFIKERSGFRFGVTGYYGGTAIQEQVPGATSGSFPTITRRGWGVITAGYFFRFGRR